MEVVKSLPNIRNTETPTVFGEERRRKTRRGRRGGRNKRKGRILEQERLKEGEIVISGDATSAAVVCHQIPVQCERDIRSLLSADNILNLVEQVPDTSAPLCPLKSAAFAFNIARKNDCSKPPANAISGFVTSSMIPTVRDQWGISANYLHNVPADPELEPSDSDDFFTFLDSFWRCPLSSMIAADPTDEHYQVNFCKPIVSNSRSVNARNDSCDSASHRTCGSGDASQFCGDLFKYEGECADLRPNSWSLFPMDQEQRYCPYVNYCHPSKASERISGGTKDLISDIGDSSLHWQGCGSEASSPVSPVVNSGSISLRCNRKVDIDSNELVSPSGENSSHPSISFFGAKPHSARHSVLFSKLSDRPIRSPQFHSTPPSTVSSSSSSSSSQLLETDSLAADVRRLIYANSCR